MDKLNSLLGQLENVAENPKAMLDKYLKAGKKVIGCFPIYTPTELVHAAGMIPMGLWGGQINPSVAGKYAPAFTCSIMRSCLELGMTGKYKGLSGAVMPMLCDTFRGICGAWRDGVKDIPLVAFIHPQNIDDSGAVEFLRDEYAAVKKMLENIAGAPISEEALNKSIEIYNKHQAVMREFLALANDHLDVITAKVRHNVMKSAHFMEKAEHTALVEEINAELKKLPVHKWQGKKVVLTGVTAEPADFLDIFAENKVAVVADDLGQESRQVRIDIPAGVSALERLAKQWFAREGCSVIHDRAGDRGKLVTKLAKDNKADGVVVCLMKFCDVEEYDYPMIAANAEENSLPVLCVDIDQSTEGQEQARTKIQTFAEMM